MNALKEDRAFLLLLSWIQKQVFYEVNPYTSELKSPQEIGLNCRGPEFVVAPYKLQDYNYEMTLRIKHQILRESIVPSLKV